ncbi:MAG TPA: hypothetical protein VK493_08840, partial [Bryobacteraceae bacterium]|nr:hypothetical protein [Bryobacteraceae bacterium]
GEPVGLILGNMSNRAMKFLKFLRHGRQSLVRATNRNHDPLLVFSMASFNFGGGWRDLLLKASPQNA